MTVKQEGLKELEDFLNDELSNYSQFQWEIEVEDSEENMFLVKFIRPSVNQVKQYVRFIYANKLLYVEIGEDCWNKIDRYDSSIKFFWQALLSWDW